MQAQRRYYVYLHRHQSDGRIFYVGKGIGRRAWSRCGRNRMWRHIAAKHGFTVDLIFSDLPEACALSLERIFILRYRALGLANFTDGGGGTSGWKHTAEAKAKIGAFWKGRVLSPAAIEALVSFSRGKKMSAEQRAKLSAAKIGKPRGPHDAKVKAKIAAAHIGMRPSEESRRKMSAAKIGKAVGRENPTYDHTERHFVHANGDSFVGTRADFIKRYSLGAPCVSAVINGKQKTVKGWRLK